MGHQHHPVQNELAKKTLSRLHNLNYALRVEGYSFRKIITPHFETQDPSEFTRPMSLLTTMTKINIDTWDIQAM